MIRVLQVYPQLNNAGTEMVIMNLYKNIDRNKIQFDFLVEEHGELDDMVLNMGGKLYYLKEKNKRKYYKALIDFFSSHQEYKIVHTHTHGRMGLVLKAASFCGVKSRIAHSHNARTDLPKVFTIYKKIMGRTIESNATDFFACSSLAAKWLFPYKYTQTKIVNNSIDLERFSYNPRMRRKIRLENNICENEKVACHIGRFAKQKNHKLVIDIANKLFLKDDSIKLILVGVGPLQDEIKFMAKKYGIEKKILFLGNRTDVNDILSASDIFILPSLHEGLGIVLVEAQASGLNCIVSDVVPLEADIGLDILERKALSQGASDWADSILVKLYLLPDRKQLSNAALSSNYDIKKTAKAIQDFYLRI